MDLLRGQAKSLSPAPGACLPVAPESMTTPADGWGAWYQPSWSTTVTAPENSRCAVARPRARMSCQVIPSVCNVSIPKKSWRSSIASWRFAKTGLASLPRVSPLSMRGALRPCPDVSRFICTGKLSDAESDFRKRRHGDSHALPVLLACQAVEAAKAFGHHFVNESCKLSSALRQEQAGEMSRCVQAAMAKHQVCTLYSQSSQ